MKTHRSVAEKVFDIVNICILIVIMIAASYPLLYIIFSSLSVPSQLAGYNNILYRPLGLQFDAYYAVLHNKPILIGYRNTIVYTIVGTSLNLIFTTTLAYALSRRGLMLRNSLMIMIVITMFFSGGLIPTYLVMKQLGIVNTWISMVFPGLIGTYNLIIMRTYFQSIPEALEESARIDGASEMKIMVRIMIPLSMPIIAVMILYYGVGHWNSWFNASIYLTKSSLYPLQLVLRNILVTGNTDDLLTSLGTIKGRDMSEIVKSAAIVIATVPILVLYPFLTEVFRQGCHDRRNKRIRIPNGFAQDSFFNLHCSG
ncbi:carbohydrate ABC transporter permease [Paenibacillus roseipurpureus]|uniref:carbohydrate ABC transporter permease n=1 Tax=Paenibacillus roseopurpureus TaxID=2918901 RepID=UPI0028E6A050|nr:carbohydrate ABC transporter permease [Paenibacillus sp. MBLB1832]